MPSRAAFEGVDLLDTVERISIPSYAIDRHGIIQWVNPAARALAGDVAGRHFTAVVAPAAEPVSSSSASCTAATRPTSSSRSPTCTGSASSPTSAPWRASGASSACSAAAGDARTQEDGGTLDADASPDGGAPPNPATCALAPRPRCSSGRGQRRIAADGSAPTSSFVRLSVTSSVSTRATAPIGITTSRRSQGWPCSSTTWVISWLSSTRNPSTSPRCVPVG